MTIADDIETLIIRESPGLHLNAEDIADMLFGHRNAPQGRQESRRPREGGPDHLFETTRGGEKRCGSINFDVPARYSAAHSKI